MRCVTLTQVHHIFFLYNINNIRIKLIEDSIRDFSFTLTRNLLRPQAHLINMLSGIQADRFHFLNLPRFSVDTSLRATLLRISVLYPRILLRPLGPFITNASAMFEKV